MSREAGPYNRHSVLPGFGQRLPWCWSATLWCLGQLKFKLGNKLMLSLGVGCCFLETAVPCRSPAWACLVTAVMLNVQIQCIVAHRASELQNIAGVLTAYGAGLTPRGTSEAVG